MNEMWLIFLNSLVAGACLAAAVFFGPWAVNKFMRGLDEAAGIDFDQIRRGLYENPVAAGIYAGVRIGCAIIGIAFIIGSILGRYFF